MPTVQLSDPTFTRLQKHAVPLVDTLETVIGRLLDFYDVRAEEAPETAEQPRPANTPGQYYHPLTPPDLSFTKILTGRYSGRTLGPKTTWNGLLFELIHTSRSHAKSDEAFRKMIPIRWVEGPKETDGYRYMPELGISLQGRDANGAWKAICQLAREMEILLEISFVWRERAPPNFAGSVGYMLIPAQMVRSEEEQRKAAATRK
jgi:hypothetical protein